MTNLATSYKPAPVVSDEFDIGDYILTIAVNTSDYNVRTAFINKYGSIPSIPYTLIVTVNSGIVVSATTTSTAALTWGTPWTGTPTFSLINNGIIVGMGGSGGRCLTASSRPPATNGEDGFAGGKAMELSGQPVSITNASGHILGGGGGGGGGGVGFCEGLDIPMNQAFRADSSGGGGGGGPGASSSSGGAGTVPSGVFDGESFDYRTFILAHDPPAASAFVANTLTTVTSDTVSQTANILSVDGSSGGIIGTTASPGVGGIGANVSGTGASTGGNGGNGAPDFGEAGLAGTAGSFTAPGYSGESLFAGQGGAGGAAGKAINLTGGTANFVSGSGSPNVKGAVS